MRQLPVEEKDRTRERQPAEPVAEQPDGHLSREHIASLQRTAGNQSVARMLGESRVLARERGGRKGKGKRETLADALSGVQNDRFFTNYFEKNHLIREASVEKATAKFRAGKNTTVLFLEGSDYGALADEVRGMTRHFAQKRKKSFASGGGNPTFMSQGSYAYVTIFDNNGQPQPGIQRHGHLVFAVDRNGSLQWQGAEVPVFAINHCEGTDDDKHPRWDWDAHEAAEPEAADDSESEEDVESDSEESSD